MIIGEHTGIRTAEPDDADYLFRMVSTDAPCSFFLDHRRELAVPTRDELREMLSRKDMPAIALFAVEDLTGSIRGFVAIRGVHPEAHYGDVGLLLGNDGDYAGVVGREALAFLKRMAFVQRNLNKVMAHCVDTETAYRALLAAGGFETSGIQREMVYTRGRWHDLETLSCRPSAT